MTSTQIWTFFHDSRMIMILPYFNNNVINGGNERGTSRVLLDTPPSHFDAFVLVNCKPMFAQVQASFTGVRKAKECWKININIVTTATLTNLQNIFIYSPQTYERKMPKNFATFNKYIETSTNKYNIQRSRNISNCNIPNT